MATDRCGSYLPTSLALDNRNMPGALTSLQHGPWPAGPHLARAVTLLT